MKYFKDLQFLLVYNFLLASLKLDESKWAIRYRKKEIKRMHRNF